MEKRFLFLLTADEDWISNHKERLAQEFDLNVFRSGKACQEALNDRQPDILILDTALPDGDGFAMHQAIRDDFMTSDVYQVLICSEAEVADEKFVADDFVLRPVGEAVFWRKIALFRQRLNQRATVSEQLSYAQNVAITAMSSMGELGVVMQFLSRSFECVTQQSVSALAVEALRQYELEGIVQLRWEGDGHLAVTGDQPASEEDMTFIDQMRTLGRIMEIGKRLVVNYEHASILINNMPDDATRCGRIRDNIATLCEGLEARIRGLLLEQDNLLKQQGIRYAVNEIRDSVCDLHARQVHDTASGHALLNRVIDDFEDAFMHMGMNAETENQLISQLVGLRQRVMEIVDRPDDVNTKLKTVVHSLETLAGEVGAN